MLAVGSSMKGNENSGYVVVYSRDGSSWELLQTITETSRTHGFGSALALSSDCKVLSIGANERNTSITLTTGMMTLPSSSRYQL